MSSDFFVATSDIGIKLPPSSLFINFDYYTIGGGEPVEKIIVQYDNTQYEADPKEVFDRIISSGLFKRVEGSE